ncbi:iron-containing alcohol dehydrogenase [Microbacterium sp. No. 7]|uniref:iron-containing alcohol dehydrogenase n=1 Tax=Microbacterium sp. No. 7 TaxID=1714373 RepID=UPI0006D00C35|nr:iron-containing alcohol dehydrogenase [Microbacterium sp. No. 7]ALJ20858.1 hypothetical protein AOA12_13470 [Microbacterium sp. No. 7]
MLTRYDNGQQPWTVLAGPGALEGMAAELDRRGIQSVLLLTGRTLARNDRLIARVRALLAGRLAAVFTECEPHVPVSVVLRVRQLMEECRADAVVALGGGSVIDTAKSAALAQAAQADERTLVEMARTGDLRRCTPSAIVALPTALAGSEFSNIASFVTSGDRMKHLIRSPSVACDIVVLDPLLATETPDALWVSTGLKTLGDACEQLAHPAVHPLVRPMLQEGRRMLSAGLAAWPRRDDEAVRHCQLGVWASYFAAFSAPGGLGVGAVLRHWLGGLTGAPHAMISTVLLPHVLRRAAPADTELLSLVEDVGARACLPSRLRDIGVPVDIVDLLPPAGLDDASLAGDAPTRGELVSVLSAAW